MLNILRPHFERGLTPKAAAAKLNFPHVAEEVIIHKDELDEKGQPRVTKRVVVTEVDPGDMVPLKVAAAAFREHKAELAEAERVAAERAEAERVAAELAEAERVAAEVVPAEAVTGENQAHAPVTIEGGELKDGPL